MMESFMWTLKVEGVYPMAFENEEDSTFPRRTNTAPFHGARIKRANSWRNGRRRLLAHLQ